MNRVASVWAVIGLVAACSNDRSDPPKPAPAPPAARAPAPAPAAPVDDGYDHGSLGATTFELSEGTPEARDHFTRGLLALHSFWYDEALRQFQAAAVADPTMNMAYWGLAMAQCKLLWGDDDVAGAREALMHMPDPSRLTPREQAWARATFELVREGDVRTSRKRFVAAMETVHDQFPDDESTTFLAIALVAATHPEDPDNLEVRKRAGALAIGVFAHNPKHPGAAHYLLHAYDTPELAELALPYARAYAKIAPAAFHARHMPAHIFSRLGMWPEAIASCQAAWDASVAAAKQEKLSANHDDFHSLSWLIEMNFELGHRKAADAALEVFAAAVRGGLNRQQRAQYATEVSSYLVRTGDGTRVDALLAPLEAPVKEDGAAPSPGMRAPDQNAHCAPPAAAGPPELLEQLGISDARARAAALRHDVPATQRYVAESEALEEKLRPMMSQMQPKEVIARSDLAHARHKRMLLARATGDDRTLLEILRKSATDADGESGGESNPSAFVLHEDIADTLVRLGQSKDAVAEYTLTLQKHPRRAQTLLKLARAQKSDPKAARATYQQLVDLWSTADEGTQGLEEARAAVTAGK